MMGCGAKRICNEHDGVAGDDVRAASVAALLDRLAELHAAWKVAAERFGPQIAQEFNPFAEFDLGETTLSRLIAYLLDPGKTHAQGDLFLRLLLDRLELDWPAEATRRATVTTERPARMDVFVEGHAEGRPYRLAIENKLRGAGDQERQITRYFEALEGMKASGRLSVVYLTVEGVEPSEDSFPSAARTPDRLARLHLLSARTLAGWLDDCRAWARAPMVAAHAEAFRTYVNISLLGLGESEMDEIVEAVTGDPERVAAYMRAVAVEETVIVTLLDKLRADLEADLQQRGLALRDWSLNYWHRWSYLGVGRGDRDDGVTARLEFKNAHLRHGAFGLHDRNLATNDRATRWYDTLTTAYGSSGDAGPRAGGPDDAWVWWQHLSESHGLLRLPPDWKHAPDVWRSMADGELAERVAEAAAELFQTIDGAD